jgi:predicted nucleic acid-binding Zn ribbon protein
MTYCFRCKECGSTRTLEIKGTVNYPILCESCDAPMVRNYKAEGVSLHRENLRKAH